MRGATKRVSIALMLGARAQAMSAERWRRLCGFCISPQGSSTSARRSWTWPARVHPRPLSVLPEAEIRAAPLGAALTHDHALDFLLAVEALRRPDAVYVGMIASRTKHATFTRYAANEGVDARSLVCPIGRAGFPRDRRPEGGVGAAFAAAEIQTRMIERAHQGGIGAARETVLAS